MRIKKVQSISFCFVFSVQRVAPRCTPWLKNEDRGKVNGLRGSGYEPDPETHSSQPAARCEFNLSVVP